ncbi:MAG: YceH family protein [Verrucomicrobiae bacterium]|nr:YceH family protein [Verrucomicrobiae bacterium]
MQLTLAEARVMGCLLEKEATTPDYYPLTLNALHAACNQTSNREPVMNLGTDEVEEAMEGLRYKQLGILVHQAGARVAKNKHTLEKVFPYLTEGERALLCVLLLRGQQTVGELRQRTERMHSFHDIESAEAALKRLCDYEPYPLIRELPSGGGRRVPTYVHLFCGEPAAESLFAPSNNARPATETVAGPSWREEMERQIAELRETVDELRGEVSRLKEELGA